MHSCVCTAVHYQSLLFAVIKVCMSIIITLAPKIVVPPSSVTLFNGSTAEFTCQTRNELYAIWRLNGMFLNTYNVTLPPRMDVDTDKESFGSGVTSYKLTITARTDYHGLVFQCVALVIDGPLVESENATLMVQGTVELWLV